VIASPGSYPSDNGDYELLVAVDPQRIVQYEVVETETESTEFKDNAGSDYSRWYFYWADDDTLWVYSGDIGTFVWHEADGKWTRDTLDLKSPFLKRVPRAFYDRLSSSDKKHYGSRVNVVDRENHTEE
jgi:hypothetical protein